MGALAAVGVVEVGDGAGVKLKIDGVEIEVGSAAEAAELLAHLREHARRHDAPPEPAPAPPPPRRRGRPPKLLQLVPPAAPVPATPEARSLDDVEAAPVVWLWHHRIPSEMLTVLYADPGIGKGTLTASIAAAVTTGGSLPDDDREREPGRVLFVVAEDNPNVTLRPRLDAAGADTSRIQVFGPERRLHLPEHADIVMATAAAMRAHLIVIDPLRGVMDGDSRPKVRKALTALEDIAARTGAAILVVHHTNKQGSLHGSQDIIGIPRSVLHVEIDRGLRCVYPVKKNLAPDVEPVYFKIATSGDVGVVEWCDPPGEVDVEESAPADDASASDQVLAELQLKVERPMLEGGVMWDAAAGAAALALDDVAKRLEASPRSLRVRVRRGTAAALCACAAVVEGQRYWTRSAIELLIERGLEVVGKRAPGPPAGTSAKPEDEKLSEEFVRELLLKNAGSIARAAESIGMVRITLRRRISALGLDDYARGLQEAAGAPRFAPAPPPTKRRRPSAVTHCACCGRGVHQKFEVCVDCTHCKKRDDGSYESAGTCPRPLTKKLRPVTVEQVEAEHRAFVERQQRKAAAGAGAQDRAAHNFRPKTEPF